MTLLLPKSVKLLTASDPTSASFCDGERRLVMKWTFGA
jgi:hypothetical protein